MNTKQLTYPTIEIQEKFWIDKETVSDNATNETREADWTCPTCGHDISTACPQREQSTTADPKPEELSRTEATTDWYDHERNDFDRGDLRDEGRNPDGSGESYGERNH